MRRKEPQWTKRKRFSFSFHSGEDFLLLKPMCTNGSLRRATFQGDGAVLRGLKKWDRETDALGVCVCVWYCSMAMPSLIQSGHTFTPDLERDRQTLTALTEIPKWLTAWMSMCVCKTLLIPNIKKSLLYNKKVKVINNSLLKGSYYITKNTFILCIWCNAMCLWFTVKKKTHFLHTVHYCCSYALPFETRRFS